MCGTIRFDSVCLSFYDLIFLLIYRAKCAHLFPKDALSSTAKRLQPPPQPVPRPVANSAFLGLIGNTPIPKKRPTAASFGALPQSEYKAKSMLTIISIYPG
jgi:hypothetical protein